MTNDISTGPKPRVLLIRPSLEQGLDQNGLYEIDYDCMHRAISRNGYDVHLVDPNDRAELTAALGSSRASVIVTVRSQSKDWHLPALGTAEHANACDKTLVTLIGNPPYYDGSLGFHLSVFRRKLAMCVDHDSIDYAETLNVSGACLLPYRPAYHDIGLDDEAQWISASRRPIQMLFVGSYDDPQAFRSLWNKAFERFTEIVRVIDGAAELLMSDIGLAPLDAIRRVATELGLHFDLRSRAGRAALELLGRFANNNARKLVLTRLVRYPSTVITTHPLPFDLRHKDCTVRAPAKFAEFLDILKQTRCLVGLNPNGMTGAISERISNAMRRGTVVVNAPNSALMPFADYSVGMFGGSLEGLDSWLDAAASGSRNLDAMGEAATRVAEERFRMDDAFRWVLGCATDPETWTSARRANGDGGSAGVAGRLNASESD